MFHHPLLPRPIGAQDAGVRKAIPLQFLINRHSDKSSPWEPGEFFELVKRDLEGHGDPQPLHDGAKVAMTLGEWQTLWSKHGQTNDQNSLTRKGIKVAFDPATREVKIDLPVDSSQVGAVQHEKLAKDYSGEPLPPPANRLPGPWQSLQKGENTFNA